MSLADTSALVVQTDLATPLGQTTAEAVKTGVFASPYALVPVELVASHEGVAISIAGKQSSGLSLVDGSSRAVTNALYTTYAALTDGKAVWIAGFAVLVLGLGYVANNPQLQESASVKGRHGSRLW